jgi:hypothetical protein
MLTSQDLNDFERITTILGEIVDHDLSKYNNENIHIVTPYSSKRFICSSGEINTKLQLTIHSDLLVKSIATQGEKDGENRGGQEQRERLRTYIDSIKEYYLRCIHNNFTLDRELAVVDDSTDALNQLTIDNFLLSDYSINRVEAQSKETDNTVVSFFAEPNKYKAFFRNDKVVYTNNNYEFMLFNGFIGKIENVIKMKARDDSNRLLYNICNELIVVDFYGQKHFFSKRETVNNLQIAYATTIHKVQGSEYEKVIFLLPASRRSNFMSSNLIYTGMTRASKALYFITSYDKPIEFIRSLGGTKRNTLIPYIAEKYNEQEIVEQI